MKRTPLKRKSGLKKISRTKIEASKTYLKLRLNFLQELPICEVCGKSKSQDVHHKKGRGKYHLDVETWLSTCRPCHDRIHTSPIWARENGYLIDRDGEVKTNE